MTNGTYAKTLKQPGFRAFFWTQFLGAFNDNFYKMVVSLVALNLIAGDADHFYVDLIALLFILPSMLFSGYAGYMADVYSKRAALYQEDFPCSPQKHSDIFRTDEKNERDITHL